MNMARMTTTFVDTGEPFPSLSFRTVSGTELSVPAALAGDYGVVLIYRGHW